MMIPLTRSAAWAFPGIRISDYERKQKLYIENEMIVIKAIAGEYDLTIQQLTKKDRRKRIVFARHICMYVMHEHCDYTYKRIANLFKLDHTSVMYGNRIVEDQIKLSHNERYKEGVLRIVNKLFFAGYGTVQGVNSK